jgi:CheY-like chemotaxis protein
MAGAIAHHFNNQMGVVIGNLEMVIDDLPQDAGAIKKLITVMEAANRAAEMSNMMLVYLGQSSHRHEPIDFSEVCLRSISLIKPTIANNVIMNHDLPTTGPVINANVNQIRQVIINLTNNAVEAIGEDGGVIKLKIKTVHPAEIPSSHRYPLGWQPQDNPYACLKVSDTGGGITNNDIENLFDPFFSRKLTGRGLGLPVVLGILRTHNGAITVDSKMGHGSIFQAFFPISGDILQQPDKGGKNDDILINTFYNAEMTGGVTLLLVEDEEIVRNMAAEMIKRLGYSVIEARDGIEAMEVFRHHQNEIHCVLSDLTMPRMNGWETLTALRKLAPNIPVILASGYDESHVMSGEHTELPQVFLGKPYKLKVLKEAISQALARRK